MLRRKINSVKKLAKKLKVIGINVRRRSNYQPLSNVKEEPSSSSSTTPTGYFAVYVGEERQRFVVPTSFLRHPLFKMLLQKAENEFGYEQRSGLVVPCSVAVFEVVVSAVECCYGQFDLENIVQEILKLNNNETGAYV